LGLAAFTADKREMGRKEGRMEGWDGERDGEKV